MVIKIIIMIICVILSALFSGTEIVYSKVNKLHLSRDADAGDKKAAKALNIANDFSSTITTILIGNNLVNIAMSSVSAVVAFEIAGDIFQSELVFTLITSIAVTFIVLIFGEILPKTIFQNYSFTLSKLLIGFVSIFKIIFLPFVFIFNKLTSFLSKPFKKIKVNEEQEVEEYLDDELLSMTEVLEENGIIDEDDATLIKSAIDFTDTLAWEIMTPRVDVLAYDIDDGFENIINDKEFFNKSRVPIYKDTIDNIIGVVNTTNVLKRILSNQEINIQELMYKPLYIHKTKPVAAVLKELRENFKHIAVVLDEWGGVMGILTIEDILEELFGDIWDETDVVEFEYKQVDDNVFIVEADMNIHDFFDLIEFDDREFDSEYSTVGGWCTEILDKFPEVNDKFTFNNYDLSIVSVDGVRVEKVRVVINKIDEQEEK